MNSLGTAQRANRQKQKGATLLLVAAGMLVLLGMTAFAVDIGRALVVKNELQNVSDSASLAGASRIGNFYTQDWSSACAAAKQGVLNNATEGKLMALGDAVIQYGVWNETAATPFTVTGTCSGTLSNIALGPNQLPAMRVSVRRDETSVSGSIKYFFAPIFGIKSTNLLAESTAAVAASSSAKPDLPFVIGDCIMQQITIPAGQPGAGGLKVGASFKAFSVQFDKTGNNNTNNIDTQKSIDCADKQAVGQWASFCTDSGCQGASKVMNLIDNPDQAPEIKANVTLTDIKNGTVQSLYDAVEKVTMPKNMTVLVPVVSSPLIGSTGNQSAPLKDFVALKITAVDKAKPDNYQGGKVPYIEFSVVSPKKYVAGTPDMDGTVSSGVITKAFLVK